MRNPPVMRERAAFGCYLAVSVYLVAGGFLYTFATEFMPFHAEAANAAWDGLPGGFQALVLALMRLGGAGLVTAGVSVLVLLFGPFRRGERWARAAVPAIALLYLAGNLWAMTAVITRTDAMPPIGVTLGMVVLVGAGAALSAGRRG